MDPGKPPFPETLSPTQPLDLAPSAAPARPGEDGFDYWFKVASLVEAKLHYEAGWTAHRMMWLVVSQSFLFSAFATTVQNGRPPFRLDAPASWLLWVLPLLGLAHSSAAMLSMRSSRKVDHAILVGRGRIEERMRRFPGMADVPLLGYDNRIGPVRGTIFTGSLASRVIPVTLMIAWTLVLIPVVIGAMRPSQPHPAPPPAGARPQQAKLAARVELHPTLSAPHSGHRPGLARRS